MIIYFVSCFHLLIVSNVIFNVFLLLFSYIFTFFPSLFPYFLLSLYFTRYYSPFHKSSKHFSFSLSIYLYLSFSFSLSVCLSFFFSLPLSLLSSSFPVPLTNIFHKGNLGALTPRVEPDPGRTGWNPTPWRSLLGVGEGAGRVGRLEEGAGVVGKGGRDEE